MANYHLYYLSESQLVGWDHIDADGDGEAIRIARERGKGQVVEVWNAHKRVRVLAPAAPTTDFTAHRMDT